MNEKKQCKRVKSIFGDHVTTLIMYRRNTMYVKLSVFFLNKFKIFVNKKTVCNELENCC
jgi:hypothetical protein